MSSTMRTFTLEEDLRPDDPSITLVCSNAPCGAAIRKGQKYGVAANTNLIYCASCANAPAEIEAPKAPPAPAKAKRAPRPRRVMVARPVRQKRPVGGQPLPPGQWSRLHARCRSCGTAERPHAGNGLCRDCKARQRVRPPMAAIGMVCAGCGRSDRPHRARGLCPACVKVEERAQQRLAERGTAEHAGRCSCFGCAEKRATKSQRSPGRDWRGMPFAEAVAG